MRLIGCPETWLNNYQPTIVNNSQKQYLVKSADHEAPHYAVSSTRPLPRHSQAQMSSSVPYYPTSPAYVPPSACMTNIHTHIKQQPKL